MAETLIMNAPAQKTIIFTTVTFSFVVVNGLM